MTKQYPKGHKKTREELEKELNWTVSLSLVFLALIIILFSVLGGQVQNKNDLKSQLSACADRDCYLKDGFWGFKTVCQDDVFGQENNGTVVSHYFHKRYSSCIQSLQFYFNKEDCQILREKVEIKVAFRPH